MHSSGGGDDEDAEGCCDGGCREDEARVRSPGGWSVPEGHLAAWDWLPPGGGRPRLDLAPWWLRCWYRTPFVDRWAHPVMWRRGCWDVRPAPEGPADDVAVRPAGPPPPTLSTGAQDLELERR